MFQKINSFIKNRLQFKTKKPEGSKGQIAIILLVVIGVLLMMVAIAVNLGKISMTKSQTQIAADSTAAFLASNMASYSESLYRTIILPSRHKTGDQGKNFGLTRRNSHEKLSTILTIVVSVIAIIISCVCPPAGAGVWAGLLAAGIIGATTATAGYVVETTYVEPMFQSMWAKQFRDLPYADQFLKQGTNFALQSAVTDSVSVLDTGDYNMDGYYCEDEDPTCQYRVGRFSVKMTEGGMGTVPEDDINGMIEFGKALADFMFAFSYDVALGLDREIAIHEEYKPDPPPGPLDDTWGVFDHDGINRCNTSNTPTLADLQPCINDNLCNIACIPYSFATPYNRHDEFLTAYDALTDPLTPGDSPVCPGTIWDENVGESGGYVCSDANTPWCFAGDQLYEDPENDFESLRELIGRDDDNMNLFGNMSEQARADGVRLPSSRKQFSIQDATGVYELIWKLYLTDLSKSPLPFNNGGECFWKTKNEPGCQEAGLWEPEIVGGFPANCTTDCYVKSNIDPLKVTGMTGDEGYCYSEDETVPLEDFFWKKGVNSYCNEYDPPYDMCNIKSCNTDSAFCEQNCQTPDFQANQGNFCALFGCGENPDPLVHNEALWREDGLEALRTGEGIDDFVRFAYGLLQKAPYELIRDMHSWYPTFIRWRDNFLPKWVSRIEDIKGFYSQFNNWTAPPSDVDFCPKAEDCVDDDPNECTEDDVISCLDRKKMEYDACLMNCSADNCADVLTELGIGFDGCGEDDSFRKTVHLYREMFRYRSELLTSLKGYYADLFDPADGKLIVAQRKINEFLDNINVKNNLNNFYSLMNSGEWLALDKGVYAWKDEDKPDGTPGLWHVVRTDVKIPTRCNGECAKKSTTCSGEDDPSGHHYDCEEPTFPEVVRWSYDVGANVWHTLTDYNCKGRCGIHNYKDDKKHYDTCGDGHKNKKSYKDGPGDEDGHKYCFKGGLVAARVARYDQPRSGSFAWATNKEFWKTLFKSPSVTNVVDPDMSDKCSAFFVPGQPLEEAILFSKRISGGSDDNSACWDHLMELLNQGTQAVSCAEYYCRMNQANISKGEAEGTSMFGMKFVDCPSDRPF